MSENTATPGFTLAEGETLQSVTPPRLPRCLPWWAGHNNGLAPYGWDACDASADGSRVDWASRCHRTFETPAGPITLERWTTWDTATRELIVREVEVAGSRPDTLPRDAPTEYLDQQILAERPSPAPALGGVVAAFFERVDALSRYTCAELEEQIEHRRFMSLTPPQLPPCPWWCSGHDAEDGYRWDGSALGFDRGMGSRCRGSFHTPEGDVALERWTTWNGEWGGQIVVHDIDITASAR